MKENVRNSSLWFATGDPWVLTQTEWDPDKNTYFETIFTQSNGYLGVRAYTEETDSSVTAVRESYLAGVFAHIDTEALKQIRVNYEWPMLSMVTLPELFSCELELDGEVFVLSEGKLEFFSRSLDMRNGVLTRHIVWVSPQGKRTRLLFERFVSAAVPHLAMQRITLTPENWAGRAVLRFDLDGSYPTYFRCGDRSFPHLRQDLWESARVHTASDGFASLTLKTRGTGHTVGIASVITEAGSHASKSDSHMLRQEVRADLSKLVSTTVVRSVVVACTREGIPSKDVTDFARDLAREAGKSGYEVSQGESTAVWEQRWLSSDMEVEGAARDQAYIRFSSFSMLQMAPFHTDTMSVPARAYAYNRYHGLYYWDSETFLLPYYLHTHPEVAGNLLSFRHRTLDGARRTARNLKSTGACFPWMTDSDDGNEQAPWGIGDYLWHQNADIAYAIDQYVLATGDTDFMAEKGLEIILESARFWMSRIEEDARGVVHLHDTVGPDELDKHGKDNGYASLMARRHLRLAVQWFEWLRKTQPNQAKKLVEKLELSSSELPAWTRAADRLAVPNVPGHTFPLQDEFLLAKKPLSFEGMTTDEAFAMRHTHRVVKQADIILAMYLLQDEFSVEQMREAYDFYEPMTLHFSSLSYNTHSILATKIGREDVAYDYFIKAAGLDLDDLRGATKDGLHAAALGGTWQTIVYGFLGMRIKPEGISFEPRLPAAWKTISLRIIYQGFRLRLRFSHSTHQIELEGGEEPGDLKITLNQQTHVLKKGLILTSPAKVVH